MDGTTAPLTPVQALERVVHCLDRSFDQTPRAKAFVRALAVVRALPPDELAERVASDTLTALDGIGSTSATIVKEALQGKVPAYLAKLEGTTQLAMSDAAAAVRARLKGDCHCHSLWSDGGAPVEAMARTAMSLGHEYLVLTDHSPRLTVAHGLDRDRLLAQLDEIAALNAQFAPFRILTGMEVDILEDGRLDLDDDLLARLDVVVASVHSKLRMERKPMTERMVLAVASPHVDILGHCTGRMIGKRPASTFDADYVFAACARFHTAVEINCRPERLDPPEELLALALDYGCFVSIDSDAHATGQLEWQPHGCEKAAAGAVPIERIINTWSADELLAWTSASGSGSGSG
jgi:putative hydrolase